MSSSSASRPLLDNNLPSINRYITDHEPSGKAVFSSQIPEELPWQQIPNDAKFCLAYATNKIPADLSGNADVNTYSSYLDNKPGIMIPGGTVLRYVDMEPGVTSPMHRTMSLDYGVVLEGAVELVLDSGEVRLLQRGDIAIQRGTNHAWRNASKTEWARMLYVLQEALPIKVGDKELGEDYGGLTGIKASRE